MVKVFHEPVSVGFSIIGKTTTKIVHKMYTIGKTR